MSDYDDTPRLEQGIRNVEYSSAVSLKRIADALELIAKHLAPEVHRAEEWIKHDGRACPVAGDTVIRARLRDGVEAADYAGSFAWVHGEVESDGDIVAYRVVT